MRGWEIVQPGGDGQRRVVVGAVPVGGWHELLPGTAAMAAITRGASASGRYTRDLCAPRWRWPRAWLALRGGAPALLCIDIIRTNPSSPGAAHRLLYPNTMV